MKDGSEDDGPTALHIAASYGHKDMVEQLLKDDRVNPSLKSKNKTPKDMVGDVSNKNTLVEMLEAAEKNYSPKKAKDINIKIEGGGRYRLSQNNHKTQAGLAVNVGNVTSAPANVIDPHLERCDSIHSDGSVSGYSSLESEQSETTAIRKLENELKRSQENIAAAVDFPSKHERELNDQLNRLAQEKKNLESKAERLSREVNCLKEQQVNTQQQLDNILKKLGDKDSRIRELEDSDEKLKEVEKKLEKAQEDLEKLKDFLAENETRLEAFSRLDEENKSLKQKVQNLESENATFKGKLEEAESQHSKYVDGHDAKLEALNKQNQEKSKLLEQEIKNLKSENARLNSRLEEIKNQHSQTSEVSLKKVEKKPPLSKVAYVSLVATSVVGSILSIVSGLFVLSMIATSVTSALVAGGITYIMSKPTTELKEVNIQSPGNNKACEV